MTQPSLSLSLVGSNAAPIPLCLEALPQTPVGPEARIAGAAREAWAVACARQAETLSQDGYNPILLVCAVDAFLGRRLVTMRLGDVAAEAVCGPLVFALSPDPKRLVAELGPGAGAGVAQLLVKEIAALAPSSSETLLLFAVNGRGLDLRVVRAAPPPAEPSAPDETAAPEPDPTPAAELPTAAAAAAP